MAGVKTLADGKTKMAILTTAPADPSAPTASELNGGIDASQLVAKNGTRISATGSDTVNDPALSSSANVTVYGASNYEGTITPYWLLGTDGSYTSGDNAVFEALKTKHTEVYVALREGPDYSDDFASGDVVDGYTIRTDNPQKPTETGAYIKRTIPVAVQAAYEHVTVGGAVVPTITSVLPSGETVGEMVVITGQFFTGTTGITMDGETVVEYEIISDSTIAMTIPASVTGAADVVVTNATGASDAYAYTAETV